MKLPVFYNPATLIFTLLCMLCLPLTGWGQNEQIENFIKAGAQDAESLTKAYLKPLPSGVGANLNTGWFNTASAHHKLGFDVQIRAAFARVPASDRNFNVNDLSLINTALAHGQPPTSPTAGGDDSPGPEVVVRDNGGEVARFTLPQGPGYHYVPTPIVQASVGLIKHTDLIVRFAPKVNIGDYGDLQMEGLGIKHSLSQWLPGAERFPLNIAVMAGYTRINIRGDLDLNPDPDAIPDPGHAGDYNNQAVKNTVDTFTAKLIVGKDLSFISLYAGAGYETSSLALDLTGDYPVSENIQGVKTTTTITDPFSYTENGVNEFSLTGGLKFKLAFFNIFGEYTHAKYTTANAGIGFSFR